MSLSNGVKKGEIMGMLRCEKCGERYGKLTKVGKRVHKEKGIKLCKECVKEYHKPRGQISSGVREHG